MHLEMAYAVIGAPADRLYDGIAAADPSNKLLSGNAQGESRVTHAFALTSTGFPTNPPSFSSAISISVNIFVVIGIMVTAFLFPRFV